MRPPKWEIIRSMYLKEVRTSTKSKKQVKIKTIPTIISLNIETFCTDELFQINDTIFLPSIAF